MDNEKVKLFFEKIDEIRIHFKKITELQNQIIEETWKQTDYDTKLYITAYVFKQLEKHMKEGGSYRNLIYNKLGFDTDSYMILQVNGVLDVHNKLLSK